MIDAEPCPLYFHFVPMRLCHVRLLRTWRYPSPYDVYNPAAAGESEAELAATFLNPSYHYYAVIDGREGLIAYRCFGADARVPGGDYAADALDMGGALRPDLTGRRLGPPLLRAAMDFARERFAPRAFRVTIAAWNFRARRACARVGYAHHSTFCGPRGVPFIIMGRPAAESAADVGAAETLLIHS